MPPMAAPGRQEGGWRVTYAVFKWPLCWCWFVLYFWLIIWIKFPVRNISACLHEETESKLYLMGLRFRFIAWLLKCFSPLNSTKLRIFTSLQLCVGLVQQFPVSQQREHRVMETQSLPLTVCWSALKWTKSSRTPVSTEVCVGCILSFGSWEVKALCEGSISTNSTYV